MDTVEFHVAVRYIRTMTTPHLVWLGEHHIPQITEHLMTLSAESLRSRFRTSMSEYSLSRYIARINFEQHVVVGFMDGGVITTLVHVAPYIDGGWELAISVAEGRRGLGLATRMLECIKPIATVRGWRRLSVLYETNNTSVAKLCARAGLAKRGSGTECAGVWEPESLISEDTRTPLARSSPTQVAAT